MPPRDYLQEEDMRMLFAYLTHLAAAPDEEHQSTRVVSWARRGELVVKGTCHICHDAVGPRPSEPALLRGAVPSLESVLKTKSISDFVHKARKGEVVSYAEPWLRHRGRMPVFYYPAGRRSGLCIRVSRHVSTAAGAPVTAPERERPI